MDCNTPKLVMKEFKYKLNVCATKVGVWSFNDGSVTRLRFRRAVVSYELVVSYSTSVVIEGIEYKLNVCATKVGVWSSNDGSVSRPRFPRAVVSRAGSAIFHKWW